MIKIGPYLNPIENLPTWHVEIGDCPNLEMPTMGGETFWKEKDRRNGWKLQKNYITQLSRILNPDNIRKAWGTNQVMEEKFKRLTREQFLEPGDVIGVSRKKALNIYEHYGIYLGDGSVVHYAGEGADFLGEKQVRVASLSSFLQDDRDYFILYFDPLFRSPRKIQVRTSFNLSDISVENQLVFMGRNRYRIYSPEETITRALSRVGENKYDLVFNNCEHFAIWCKTGVSESFQVKRVVDGILSKQGR